MLGLILHLLLSLSKLTCTDAFSTSYTVSEAPENPQINVNKPATVLPPDASFPTSEPHQVSVVSYNLLAPYYNTLSEPLETRPTVYQKDFERYEVSIQKALSTKADILCLQEVEDTEILKNLLTNAGYKYFWSPLVNRPEDPVGLALCFPSAWHNVESVSFRRGNVVHLQNDHFTISIANLHLPAKPSRLASRLRAVRSACKGFDSLPPADLVLAAGDWNGDGSSQAVKLARYGRLGKGKVEDRGFRHKLTKDVVARLHHQYRFQDVYQGSLRQYANVTVSLHEPVVMDHVLWNVQEQKQPTQRVDDSFQVKSRRRSRRLRVAQSRETITTTSQWKVSALLATMDLQNPERTHIIHQGLPSLPEFPSDHLPVGAQWTLLQKEKVEEQVSPSHKKRPTPYQESMATRRRHNAVLRILAEFLESHGAQVMRDKTLYSWPWLQGVSVRHKSRAPDLVALIHSTLLVCEVTVCDTEYLEKRWKAKQNKYADVIPLLQQAQPQLDVHEPLVFLFAKSGKHPLQTLKNLKELSKVCKGDMEEDPSILMENIQQVLDES